MSLACGLGMQAQWHAVLSLNYIYFSSKYYQMEGETGKLKMAELLYPSLSLPSVVSVKFWEQRELWVTRMGKDDSHLL